MKIKNYKEWDYMLILVVLVLLIAFLTSCSSSKVVYRQDHKGTYTPANKKSEITGWVRSKQ